MKILTAVPVYNEQRHVHAVLDSIAPLSDDLLVVDDGSQDQTPQMLLQRQDIYTIQHPRNLGYGAALRSAFQFALDGGYDALITLDCDGQHQPTFLPQFRKAIETADIVSGSRYLQDFAQDGQAPQDRRTINRTITSQLNDLFGWNLTDAFCGFKAYSAHALRQFDITEDGYAMPLQLWSQAYAAGLSIRELAVPRIYLDEKRSFGGTLDDSAIRLEHYRHVLQTSLQDLGLEQQFLVPIAGDCHPASPCRCEG